MIKPWVCFRNPCRPAPPPARCGDTRGPTRHLSIPREADRSPPWRPGITGQGWTQQQELRNKAFCETRNHTRSQKQQELVNPKSPSVRNFPKHLYPVWNRRQARHIPEVTQAQVQPPHQKDHSRSQATEVCFPSQGYLWSDLQELNKPLLGKLACEETDRVLAHECGLRWVKGGQSGSVLITGDYNTPVQSPRLNPTRGKGLGGGRGQLKRHLQSRLRSQVVRRQLC